MKKGAIKLEVGDRVRHYIFAEAYGTVRKLREGGKEVMVLWERPSKVPDGWYKANGVVRIH